MVVRLNNVVADVVILLMVDVFRFTRLDDEDDDDLDSLAARIPPNCSLLQELMITSQGCILLLQIKQHLKEMYAITDRYCAEQFSHSSS